MAETDETDWPPHLDALVAAPAEPAAAPDPAVRRFCHVVDGHGRWCHGKTHAPARTSRHSWGVYNIATHRRTV